MYKIPFNKPTLLGNEIQYLQEAVAGGHMSGDGPFTKRCSEFLEQLCGAKKVLLTSSCTHALEIAALLLDLHEGDEVILPSFAFVTTANAFVLRGARPVFVDIRPDTLNMDESLIRDRITSRTRAIIPLHYAGISCEMDPILALASKNGVAVVEDAAQGVGARYRGRPLGTIGDAGAYSFHETKNISCGEGGALILNRPDWIERAEIIRQKGTNRNKFFRGETDKYTWCDLGSSYVLSDALAAFLLAQLEQLEFVRQKRREIFLAYHNSLRELEEAGKIRLPVIPDNVETNHHLFYMILESERIRDHVMNGLKRQGILAVFHYVPLHTSPMGLHFGYQRGELPLTEDLSARLLRLPFYNSLTEEQVELISKHVKALIQL